MKNGNNILRCKENYKVYDAMFIILYKKNVNNILK